jgi:hypothetical protein
MHITLQHRLVYLRTDTSYASKYPSNLSYNTFLLLYSLLLHLTSRFWLIQSFCISSYVSLTIRYMTLYINLSAGYVLLQRSSCLIEFMHITLQHRLVYLRTDISYASKYPSNLSYNCHKLCYLYIVFTFIMFLSLSLLLFF